MRPEGIQFSKACTYATGNMENLCGQPYGKVTVTAEEQMGQGKGGGAFPSHTGIGRSARKDHPSSHRWRGAMKMALKERQGDNTAGARRLTSVAMSKDEDSGKAMRSERH